MERIVCEEEPTRPSSVAIQRAASETGERSQESLRRRLSGDLDKIVLMALRKEPRRRYASVEKFSGDIERHLRNLPVTARPSTWNYQALRFVQRNGFSVIAASLVATTLIGGIVATTREARIAEHNRRIAVGRELAAESERLLFNGNPIIATLLAVESTKHLHSLETDQALRHALHLLPRSTEVPHRRTHIRSMSVSPDGHWLTTASEDGSVDIHDIASGRLLHTEDLGAAPSALAFDFQNRGLAITAENGSLVILSLSDFLRVAKKLDGRPTAVAFHPSGETVSVALAGGKVLLFKRSDLQETRRLEAAGTVRAEAFSFAPDGESLAAGSSDGYVHIWEISTGRERPRLDVAVTGNPETIGVNALQFSLDGKKISAAGKGHTAKVFESG